MRNVLAALTVLASGSFGIADEFVMTSRQAAIEGLWFGRGNIDRYVLVINNDKFAIANRAGTETSKIRFLKSPDDRVYFELTRQDKRRQLGILKSHGKRMDMRLSYPNGPQPKMLTAQTGLFYQFCRTPSDESLKTLTQKLIWPKSANQRFVFDPTLKALRIAIADLKVESKDNQSAKVKSIEQLPTSVRYLAGKRVATSGYMYPPNREDGLTSFSITDERILNFGLAQSSDRFLAIELKKGQTASFDQTKPFRVIGTFQLEHSKEHNEVYYTLNEAELIEE